MSKRNKISFTRPADPKFLRLMKEQIGYKDGPDIEAKVRCLCAEIHLIACLIFNTLCICFQRQRLENGFDSDSDPDLDEEAPQVVVLKTGDLTAEEAEETRLRIEKGNITKN